MNETQKSRSASGFWALDLWEEPTRGQSKIFCSFTETYPLMPLRRVFVLPLLKYPMRKTACV